MNRDFEQMESWNHGRGSTISDKKKTKEILDRLIIFCAGAGFICIPEMQFGAGYSNPNSGRRADLFVIEANKNPFCYTYEIKVSRQDFKKDIEDNHKQDLARLFSHFVYYVAPKGLLKTEEIPLWAGLIEVDLSESIKVMPCGVSTGIKYSKHAPQLQPVNPTWNIVASAIRKGCFFYRGWGQYFHEYAKEIKKALGIKDIEIYEHKERKFDVGKLVEK